MDAFEIARMFDDPNPNPVKIKYGTVSAAKADGSLSVVPDGQTISIPAIRCCHVAVGSRVVMLVAGTEWLAVATIGGDTGSSADAYAANGMFFESLQRGTAIPSGSSLDDCKTAGTYYIADSATAATIGNCPWSGSGGAVVVENSYRNGSGSNSTYYKQTAYQGTTSAAVYSRTWNNQTKAWSAWSVYRPEDQFMKKYAGSMLSDLTYSALAALGQPGSYTVANAASVPGSPKKSSAAAYANLLINRMGTGNRLDALLSFDNGECYAWYGAAAGSWRRIDNDGTVLYNNASGSNGTITLAQSAAAFSALEIYYRTDDGRHCGPTRVDAPNGKKAVLFGCFPGQGAFWLKGRSVAISGTAISTEGTDYNNVNAIGGQPVGTNVLYITKVIGY